MFRDRHQPGKPMLIPNPWDVGSAKMLDELGFEALATTSFGLAITRGAMTVDQGLVLENARAICEATELPLNLDYENAYASNVSDIPASIQAAYDSGVVGFSIEDCEGGVGSTLYDFDTALQRVEAAVKANRSLSVPMVLTARTEILFYEPDAIDQAIERLQVFSALGADVLYAPNLQDLKSMERLIAAVDKPVNIVMGFADPNITLQELADIGVARITIGAGLTRVAMVAAREAAMAMKAGNFGFVEKLRNDK